MLAITPIPAFTDNYIWLLHDPETTDCIVVDPGDAKPVLNYLAANNLRLAAILLTHHHADHIGGVKSLVKNFKCPVYGPETIAEVDHPVVDEQVFTTPGLKLEFEVLSCPGHTLDHIAYVHADNLFCGDTLFLSGCGRLFEGTAEQMFNSLNKLALLDESIKVYCAHEYTLTNLQFALSVEPNNKQLQLRLQQVQEQRANGEITIPASLMLEKLTNPFLRCMEPEIIASCEAGKGTALSSPLEVFTELRRLKDKF